MNMLIFISGFSFSQMERTLSFMFILETGSILCVCFTPAYKKKNFSSL